MAGESIGDHLPGGPTEHPQPNQAVELTAHSVRCAPAVGGGSPRAFGIDSRIHHDKSGMT
jgi:hypothetical protein